MAAGAGAPAWLLDVSRLVSRVGRMAPTGIDRVEAAYLRRLLDETAPLWGLARIGRGHVLLDRRGLAAFAARLGGAEPWGPPDWRGVLRLRLPPVRRRAEADLRRLAAGRAGPGALGRLLASHLPAGTRYLNVGHSNLARPVIAAIRAVPGARVGVLVHDAIPLDHPEFSRPEATRTFADRLCAAAGADVLLYPSAAARSAVERHLARAGRVPQGHVLPLGVTPAPSDPAGLPAGLDGRRPLFLALGTIEPRKDHALLLDVWEALRREGPAPQLVVAGARGWGSAALFRRLDALARDPCRDVIEAPGLSDGAVAALMDRAAALLFPSRAEGFGLPPVEAAARGCPVVASDLPVLREVLGDYPVYAPCGDLYAWKVEVTALARSAAGAAQRPAPRPPPRWDDHFKMLFTLL